MKKILFVGLVIYRELNKNKLESFYKFVKDHSDKYEFDLRATICINSDNNKLDLFKENLEVIHGTNSTYEFSGYAEILAHFKKISKEKIYSDVSCIILNDTVFYGHSHIYTNEIIKKSIQSASEYNKNSVFGIKRYSSIYHCEYISSFLYCGSLESLIKLQLNDFKFRDQFTPKYQRWINNLKFIDLSQNEKLILKTWLTSKDVFKFNGWHKSVPSFFGLNTEIFKKLQCINFEITSSKNLQRNKVNIVDINVSYMALISNKFKQLYLKIFNIIRTLRLLVTSEAYIGYFGMNSFGDDILQASITYQTPTVRPHFFVSTNSNPDRNAASLFNPIIFLPLIFNRKVSVGPGGIFHTDRLNAGIVLVYLLCISKKLFKIPYKVQAVDINFFGEKENIFSLNIIRRIFLGANDISVRDAETASFLRKLCIDIEVSVVPCPSFEYLNQIGNKTATDNCFNKKNSSILYLYSSEFIKRHGLPKVADFSDFESKLIISTKGDEKLLQLIPGKRFEAFFVYRESLHNLIEIIRESPVVFSTRVHFSLFAALFSECVHFYNVESKYSIFDLAPPALLRKIIIHKSFGSFISAMHEFKFCLNNKAKF